jgi:hypothetical protein
MLFRLRKALAFNADPVESWTNDPSVQSRTGRSEVGHMTEHGGVRKSTQNNTPRQANVKTVKTFEKVVGPERDIHRSRGPNIQFVSTEHVEWKTSPYDN